MDSALLVCTGSDIYWGKWEQFGEPHRLSEPAAIQPIVQKGDGTVAREGN